MPNKNLSLTSEHIFLQLYIEKLILYKVKKIKIQRSVKLSIRFGLMVKDKNRVQVSIKIKYYILIPNE